MYVARPRPMRRNGLWMRVSGDAVISMECYRRYRSQPLESATAVPETKIPPDHRRDSARSLLAQSVIVPVSGLALAPCDSRRLLSGQRARIPRALLIGAKNTTLVMGPPSEGVAAKLSETERSAPPLRSE